MAVMTSLFFRAGLRQGSVTIQCRGRRPFRIPGLSVARPLASECIGQVSMIEKAMRDVHFSAHPTRSAKQQASRDGGWGLDRQRSLRMDRLQSMSRPCFTPPGSEHDAGVEEYHTAGGASTVEVLAMLQTLLDILITQHR